MANKLLLADDSQTIQKVVEIVLNPEGFEIIAFNNGEDVLKALESVMPDVILADIEMPKLNGYQLCEKIKGNASTLHIPVILLAGAFEPFDEDYAKSVGADDFILKPFESHELISKVKSLLIQQETPETPEMAAATAAEAFEMPRREAVSAEVVKETEWFESYPFSLAEESSPGETNVEPDVVISLSADARGFDEELQESLRALEVAEQEEAASVPEAISIEEISKMVKEAIGGPSASLKEERARAPQREVPPAAISGEAAQTVEDIVRDSVQYLSGVLKGDIEAAVREQLRALVPALIKDSVTKAVSEMVPGIFEETLKGSMVEISGSIQSAINAEIKRVVPDLAETIIKREIEKIASELK